MLTLTPEILSTLKRIVGSENLLDDPENCAFYGKDWLKHYKADPCAVIRPGTIEEVQKIVEICYQNQIAIVPSGGRTGLSGGAAATSRELIITLDRLNHIGKVDSVGRTITCEAGVITSRLQEYLLPSGFFLPVDFASKGSSQIGGNIATNVGGIRVIRYGPMRHWVLGVKVVTGEGKLIEINGSLIKNQSGYDLRSLIIGSEGTLGIIVEATLLLAPLPKDAVRALVAFDDLKNLESIFLKTREKCTQLLAFEYFDYRSLKAVLERTALRNPFSKNYSRYILIEVENEEAVLMGLCEGLLSNGMIHDAVISASTQQATELLSYREEIPESLATNKFVHKNDVAVSVSSFQSFIEALENHLFAKVTDFDWAVFGHVGDGNVHINYLAPADVDREYFHNKFKKLDLDLFELIKRFGGTISAEHGVGLLKKDFLHFCRTKEEISLFRGIKKVFDPHGIMNPGKMI